MRDFLLRFIAAGLLVASIPWVASQFNSRVAGVVLLFPAVTLSGFLALGSTRGSAALAHASAGSLLALPAVLAFLLAVHAAARRGFALPVVLAIGVTAWLITASLLALATPLEREIP